MQYFSTYLNQNLKQNIFSNAWREATFHPNFINSGSICNYYDTIEWQQRNHNVSVKRVFIEQSKIFDKILPINTGNGWYFLKRSLPVNSRVPPIHKNSNRGMKSNMFLFEWFLYLSHNCCRKIILSEKINNAIVKRKMMSVLNGKCYLNSKLISNQKIEVKSNAINRCCSFQMIAFSI